MAIARRAEFVVTRQTKIYKRPSSGTTATLCPKGTRLHIVDTVADDLGYAWWKVSLTDGRLGFMFDTTEGYFPADIVAPVSQSAPRQVVPRKWLSRGFVALAIALVAVYLFAPLGFGDYANRARSEIFGWCPALVVMLLFGAVWSLGEPREGFFSLNGRATRSSFWRTMPPFYLAILVLAYLAALPSTETSPYASMSDSPYATHFEFGNGLFLEIAITLVAFLAIPVQVRRSHDLGNSGWVVLINLVPILGWVLSLLLLGVNRGTWGPNKYGADPLLPATATQSGDTPAMT